MSAVDHTKVSRSEQAIKVTAHLYEMRAAARKLFGDRYYPYMAELAPGIKLHAVRQGMGQLQAMMDLAKDTYGAGRIALMAAYVELVEPSEQHPLTSALLAERKRPTGSAA